VGRRVTVMGVGGAAVGGRVRPAVGDVLAARAAARLATRPRVAAGPAGHRAGRPATSELRARAALAGDAAARDAPSGGAPQARAAAPRVASLTAGTPGSRRRSSAAAS